MTLSDFKAKLCAEGRAELDEILKRIDSEPVLMSLLYDLDLLPEQINSVRAFKMLVSVLTHWPEIEQKPLLQAGSTQAVVESH